MKKRLPYITLATSFIITFVIAVILKPVLSDTFNQNDIIDDAIFDDYSSMSVTQIQTFINKFPSSCLLPANQPASLSPITFVDINTGKTESPAQIIWYASNNWHISPKVILTTLEKEESLVSGSNGCDTGRYNAAMGYACPDTLTLHDYPDIKIYGTCVTKENYAGFSHQVNFGSWQLKFNKERAYGNTSWGDYGYICYSGYMTKGWRSRCDGQAASYYDGYATIDGSPVYMSNGSTAALYDYTPHFSGNRNFQAIFTQWFGSTYLPQPIGALLYRQTSNGKIYLVANSERFYIPSYSLMENFRISTYATIPADDATISAITDGGILTNIIRDDAGNVYMVNDGYKHYVPSPTVCTNWAIGCFDSNIVHNLGYDFTNTFLQTGMSINSTALYNGVYYQLSSGVRLPYANSTSFIKAGFTTSSAIYVDPTNLAQTTLGKLQISTAGIIRFSPKPTIYYFNGTDYYTIGDMDVYSTWLIGLSPAITPPLSSYNTTEDVVVKNKVSYWAQSSDGTKYLIGNGKKIPLTADQQKLWGGDTSIYITGLDGLLSRLGSAPLGTFIKSGYNFYKLNIADSKKQYIISMDDYYALGGNSNNTTRISTASSDLISSGPIALPSGRVVRNSADGAIYVADNNSLLWITSIDSLNSYNFDMLKRESVTSTYINAFGTIGTLQVGLLPTGDVVVPFNGILVKFSASQVTNFGLDKSKTTAISSTLTSRATIKSATIFLRNSDDGKIYYAADGELHYVNSIDKFYELGGATIPLTKVNNSIISLFAIGAPV